MVASTQQDHNAPTETFNLDQSFNSPNQVMVTSQGDTFDGMGYTDLYNQFLASEVAKLPPSASTSSLLPDFSDSAFTFGASNESTDQVPFDPSTFMPAIPGSPISPSETGSLSHSAASPMSFADFEDLYTNPSATGPESTSNDTNAYAIDPSIFQQPLSNLSYSISPEQAFSHAQLPTLEPSTLSSTALPPLPDLPIPTAYDLPVPPPPAHVSSTQAVTASGRPKRHASVNIVEEAEEEDEEMLEDDDGSNMSDASEVTTRSSRRGGAAAGGNKKKPATKKARRSSSTSATTANEKKLPKTSVLPLASETLHKTSAKSSLPPVPQWKDKPDEETYSKLSSKEKRQMRNKISARNFRHRRKEYITTLEEEISTRDTLINSLQDEVGTLRTDNSTLRSEVALLKDKWQELLDKMSSLAGSTPAPSTATAGLGVNPSKAIATASTSAPVQIKEEEPWALDSPRSSSNSPLPDTSAPAVASTSTGRRIGTRSTNGIQRPNLSKDVAPSTLGRRSTGSWTTQGGGFGAGGGFMPVHTTLVPDFSSLASNLTTKSPFASAPSFNPNLNNLTSQQLDELSNSISHLRPPTTSAQDGSSSSAFQDLFSSNPFYLNTASLEQQRAGLYSRIAHNASGLAQAKKEAPSSSSENSFLPVPAGFRPAFFSSSSSSTTPSLMSTNKHSPSSTTTQELLAFQSPSNAPAPPSHQEAYQLRLANLATQTLLSKMTNAFVAAFSGSSPTSSSSQWDGQKVAAIVSGQAKLQIVPVDNNSNNKSRTDDKKPKFEVDDLDSKMSGLNLLSSASRSTVSPPTPHPTRSRSLSPSATMEIRRNCSFDDVVSRWTKTSSSSKEQSNH